MNPLTNVRNTQKLNERMLEMGVEDSESWHRQYKDSAYIFIGGLPYGLTEGDILCVFSQYGEIVNVNLVRDKKTGKTKGFCFLCYEDQRSTILAVDNFNGIKLGGRTIRVDHCSNYRRPLSDEKDEQGNRKEIIEEGCAPKTPPPSPPQSDEEEEVLELPKKRKKEKKQKKEKMSKEEKSQKKKRKMTSSSEEEDGERKQKLDLLEKERRERAPETERDRHGRTERGLPRDANSVRKGGRDGDFERDCKGNEDVVHHSRSDHGRDHNHTRDKLERERKHDFHGRDVSGVHDPANRDNRIQHIADNPRDHRDRAYHTSRSDRNQEFDERKRNRFDKQRDYRANEGRSYERHNRDEKYSDHTSRGDRDRDFDERRRGRSDKQSDHREEEGRSYERRNRDDKYGDRKDRR